MKLRKDSAYTNGVIAVREKKLLKDKLFKMCAMSEEEALRVLLESGFGGGDSAKGTEELILADERETDEFIREYSPSDEVTEYLLAPRDFHNAKAVVKAQYLKTDAQPYLGSDGMFSKEDILRFVGEGEYEKLGRELGEAVGEALKLFEGERPSGAETGFLFDKALFTYLSRILPKRSVCGKLLARKADMTNLLTCFRAQSFDEAKKFLLSGGTLSEEVLSSVFTGTDGAMKAFDRSEYRGFVKSLCADRDGERPFSDAEKTLQSFETDFFAEKPYELSGKGTFLYYVFRRRAENENVRIVFVCLRAGLSESEIKKRLRGSV